MLAESHKLVYSICILVFIFYLSGISNVWTHRRALNNKNIYPLQDVGFEIFKNIDHTNFVGMNDYLLYVVVLITLVWTIFYSNKKIMIFKRWILMIAVLFFIRMITIPSTILTQPFENLKDWETCIAYDYDYGHILLSPITMVFNNKLTCFDFFYSGHTINVIVPTLIIGKYFPTNNKRLRYAIVSLVWILSIMCMFFIIFLRSHYTIDVEAGLIFTILLWYVMDYQMTYQVGLFSYWETQPIVTEDYNDIEL